MSKAATATDHTAIGDRAQLRAFVTDDETRKVVEQVIGDLMIPGAVIQKGDVQAAIAVLGAQRSPRILLVDISGTDLPLSAVNQLAEVCEPGITVITIGDRNDVGLFRELISHGVSDYIVKPVTTALLQKSLLNSVEHGTAPRQTSRLGRLVTVLGARGGVGTSMVASGLAWSIANHRRRRVALFDLDLHFGSIALGLDLDPCRGLREALENPSRIDGLYVERTLVKHSDTLFVLGAEEGLDELVFTDKEALAVLLTELRTKFHFVVADLPRTVSSASQQLLANTANLLVVTDLSLVGMRDTMRILQLMQGSNAACGITVVANRVGEYREGEIARGEFEKGIGRQIDVLLPFDRAAVFASMNAGKPVAAGKDKVALALQALAEQISGSAPRATAGRGLRRWFGRWSH